MGNHQRLQPLGREVFCRQDQVHVGRTRVPSRTVTIAATEARSFGVQPQGA